MNDKEKLISLLILTDPNPYTCESESGSCELTTCTECRARSTADLLIANGVTVQEWISAKDRLPEPWKQVLIYSRHDFCESAFYIGVPGKWRVTWNHEMLEADSVTHWMPLPEPPKGE